MGYSQRELDVTEQLSLLLSTEAVFVSDTHDPVLSSGTNKEHK